MIFLFEHQCRRTACLFMSPNFVGSEKKKFLQNIKKSLIMKYAHFDMKFD